VREDIQIGRVYWTDANVIMCRAREKILRIGLRLGRKGMHSFDGFTIDWNEMYCKSLIQFWVYLKCFLLLMLRIDIDSK